MALTSILSDNILQLVLWIAQNLSRLLSRYICMYIYKHENELGQLIYHLVYTLLLNAKCTRLRVSRKELLIVFPVPILSCNCIAHKIQMSSIKSSIGYLHVTTIQKHGTLIERWEKSPPTRQAMCCFCTPLQLHYVAIIIYLLLCYVLYTV